MTKQRKSFLSTALNFILLSLPTVFLDEFSNPSHTPAVQILFPRRNSCTGSSFDLVFAAPYSSEVQIYIDDSEVARVIGAIKYGKIVGLSAGKHRIRAAIDFQGSKSEHGHVFNVCDCCSQEENFVTYLPPLENPLETSRRYMHADVFYKYVRWQGRFEEGYLIDWLGVRTRYSWDCIRDGGYYRFVPSRRLECERYDALLPAAIAGDVLEVEGFLPPVDDEYPEYVDMLRSVERSGGRPYVVMELGSSWGTWGARAVAAYRARFPQGAYHLVAVESGLHRFRQLEHHVRANNVHNATLHHALVSPHPDRGRFVSGYAVGDPVGLTLPQLLAPLDHVDYLDLDIQGAEGAVLSDERTAAALDEKVYAMHIGTHSVELHHDLRRFFLDRGWVLELDLAHSADMVRCDASVAQTPGGAWDWLQRDAACTTATENGPVYVRDGMLGFFNPRFADRYE